MLLDLLKKDNERMRLLFLVAQLELPDCWIAAGFVRNMVWDQIHKKQTPLNDIDVLYYSREPGAQAQQKLAEKQLARWAPEYIWEVKNQAKMHLRNNDTPYNSSTDAMRYWPEKETAVALRLLNSATQHDREPQIEVAAPFGVESLLQGCLSHNPLRSKAIFEQRMQSKQWLNIWPNLNLRL